MPMLVRSAGGWKAASPHVRVAGAWQTVAQVHVKRDGAWKPLWSYAWQTGSWGGCSVSCGGGYQYRTVTCRRSDGVNMPDAACAGVSKPATSQSCNTHSCYSYSWYTGSWGSSCSAYCGSGTYYRSVYCRRSDGTQVSDAYCDGSKPSTSTSCTASCYWSYDSYGGCSTTCGTGTQTRTATCMSNDTGSYHAIGSSYCTSYLGSATTSQACTACTACGFSETSTVSAKVKQLNAIKLDGRTNWTYSEVRTSILANFPSVLSWWNGIGRSESVCSWASAECCRLSGYAYY